MFKKKIMYVLFYKNIKFIVEKMFRNVEFFSDIVTFHLNSLKVFFSVFERT